MARRQSIVRAATKAPSYTYRTPSRQGVKTVNLITPKRSSKRSVRRSNRLSTIASAETVALDEGNEM